jgi:hypothetical protein
MRDIYGYLALIFVNPVAWLILVTILGVASYFWYRWITDKGLPWGRGKALGGTEETGGSTPQGA